MEIETLYSTPYRPDPARALDVLGFILAPTEAFCEGCPEARDLVIAAKHEAAETWQRLNVNVTRT